MKKYGFVIVALFVFAAVTISRATGSAARYKNNERLGNVLSDKFTLYYLEDELGATIQTYLDQNEPPMLYNLAISPAEPAPGDEITITAEIRNNPVNTDSETMTVTLNYSYDEGETWLDMDMEDQAGEGKSWSATVPPMQNAGTFRYFFLAEDDAGNYYVEVPETDIEWAADKDEGYVVSIDDENKIYRIVPDDLDMLSLSLGYDGELLYFKTVVEGDIAAGTITPFNVNVYSVGFFFPDSPGGMGPKPDYVLIHSQHAQFIGFPIIGLLDVDKNLSEIYAADARYYSRRNTLYMRIKQSVFDKHDYDVIRIVFGTAIGTSAMPIELETKDISRFMNFVPGGHSLEIR